MSWQFTPYAVPLYVGVAILLSIVALSWQRRATQGAINMLLLCLATAVFIFGYAFEISSTTLDDVFFWIRFEYVGLTTAPVLVFALIWGYTTSRSMHSLLADVVLFTIPAVTLIFAWTNAEHELIWRDMRLERSGDLFLVDFEPGGWYWVHVVYVMTMISGGALLLARALRRATGIYRKQLALFLLAVLLPMVGVFVYLSGVLPVRIDLNAYALTGTAVIMAWAIYNYQLLDIMPVAREMVLASMDDAVIVIDAYDRLVDINAAAQRLFRLDPAQHLGHRIDAVLAQWPQMAMRATGQSDREDHRDELPITIEGGERVVDLRVSPLLSRGGRTEGRLLVLRDITDRVQAERTLRATNERLATLQAVDGELTRKLDVRYVATVALDAALRLSRADAACIGLMDTGGIRILHILGNYPDDMLDRVISPVTGSIERALHTREPAFVQDVAHDAQNTALMPGTRAQMVLPLFSREQVIGLLLLETSDPARFTSTMFGTLTLLATRVAVAIDNANAYEERYKLATELDAFAHTVAHDLKNPLSVLRGYAEVLLETDDLDERARRDYLREVVKGSLKMDRIIQALLLLSQVRSAQALPAAALDMPAIIREAQARVANLVERYTPQFTLPAAWPEVYGYAPWVEEIWVNYLSNAIKYGGRPPVIEVGCDVPRPGVVRFWVQDNGPGLSPEQQTQLFQPFSRLTQSSIEGHGLGLSIVQRIAGRLNGQVGVECAPGEGCRFFFTLPVRPSGDEATTGPH